VNEGTGCYCFNNKKESSCEFTSTGFKTYRAAAVLLNVGQCKIATADNEWGHTGVNFGALSVQACAAAIAQNSNCNQNIFIARSGHSCYCFSDLNADESSCEFVCSENQLKTYRRYDHTPSPTSSSVEPTVCNSTFCNATGYDPEVVTVFLNQVLSYSDGSTYILIHGSEFEGTSITGHSMDSGLVNGVQKASVTGENGGVGCSLEVGLAFMACPPAGGIVNAGTGSTSAGYDWMDDDASTECACSHCIHGYGMLDFSVRDTSNKPRGSSDKIKCDVWFTFADARLRVAVAAYRATWLGFRINKCSQYM